MAAAPLSRLTRRAWRAALGALAAALAITLAYLLAAWIGSSVARNAGWTPPAEGVEIMVETNGTHTGIVMPIVTPQKDWRETFPSAARATPSGEMPTHIAIGWGEREVFLNVPTWNDLHPLTALRIATVGGDPVMRVSHYIRPAAAENYRPLRIAPDQYARLVAGIEAALPPPPKSGQRPVLVGTVSHDAYYDAAGSYTMGNTCNSWVGAMLADAGIAMGAWTPLAGGVMKWIPRPGA